MARLLAHSLARLLTHSLTHSKPNSCIYREELEFIANTLIFILAGVIIAGNIYQSEHSVGATIQIQARDYGYAFLLWVVLIVSHDHWTVAVSHGHCTVAVCISMLSMRAAC